MFSRNTLKKDGWDFKELWKRIGDEMKGKRKGLKVEKLALFTQQLGTMIQAGLPIVTALDVLKEQVEDKGFCEVIKEVRNDIAAGMQFSESIGKFGGVFPPMFIGLVKAGEASGALPEILGSLAGYLTETARLVKKVKSALAYPAVVITLAIALVNVLMIFVIPTFAEMFKGFNAALPLPTQVLIDVSEFLQNNIIKMGCIGVVGLYFLMRYIKTPLGRKWKDRMLWKVPIVGELIRKTAVSRFAKTYGIMARSGVPILTSLEICGSSANNTYIEETCREMMRVVSQGEQISLVLERSEYFPRIMYHYVKVGEKTGNVEVMMQHLSRFIDMEVDATVGALTSMIEPILIVGLGLIIGTIVICMFMPIFQLASLGSR